MNFAQMLMGGPAPKVTKHLQRSSVGAAKGVNNPCRLKAMARYRAHMFGQTLTTPQLAAKLGYGNSSSITKTLWGFARDGVVECLGEQKHTGAVGKGPLLWKWTGD